MINGDLAKSVDAVRPHNPSTDQNSCNEEEEKESPSSSSSSGVDLMASDSFYSNAEKYWSGVPATIEGMLGGFEFVSKPDVVNSTEFLSQLASAGICAGRRHAMDCGSGIGRVTKHLLLPLFETVDMVEVTSAFINQAESYIGPEQFSRVGERFCCGLQDFRPPTGVTYDLIWCQWVLGHLTDRDLAEFLVRCAGALSPDGGVIVVKENVTGRDSPDFDREDSSLTRTVDGFLKVFADAGLQVVRKAQQRNFPTDLYPVFMFGLQPPSDH